MGKIIACTNEKGGVAKTTTVKNLAIGLAREGQNVLVIDLDPSSGLTKSLGFRPENYKNNIHSIFEKTIGLEKLESDFGIIQHPEGIQLIPGSERLREFEYRMMAAAQRETILRRYIYGIRQQYDYIFIDCPAGLGIYTTNALYSADSIIIPVIPHSLDVESMQILFKKIHEVRTLNGTRKKPELMGYNEPIN